MMSMCPRCYKLHSNFWSVPLCTCNCKSISVSAELICTVKLLIERGFIVAGATCTTHDNQTGVSKTTHIQIDLGDNYPNSLFVELPPDWLVSASHLVRDNQILQPPLTILSCICRHPPNESDELSVSFDKLSIVSNLEVWLENIDPDACKAILSLI